MGQGGRGGAAMASLVVALSSIMASEPSSAQENKLDLSARVVETYDSNILRLTSSGNAAQTGNMSTSPRAVLDFERRFARQRVFLAGTAGYVFNSRYRLLNREELSFAGGADLRFGARCRIDTTASLLRAQSDLEDLGGLIANTITVQDYTAQASCPRPVGLYPTLGGGYFRTNNSEIRRERNQSIADGRAGLVYHLPSLGEAEVFGQFVAITRNRLVPTATGAVHDNTNVKTFGIRLKRAVGTRVAADAQISYTNANPAAPGIPGFSGITYSGSLSYEPAPRLGFTGSFGRAVSARGNVGTSFYISQTAGLTSRARLSARTTLGGGIEFAKRDFRGEDPTFQSGPRGADRLFTAQGNLGYALARPLGLNLSARYRTRNAQNDIYDYSSLTLALSASLKL